MKSRYLTTADAAAFTGFSTDYLRRHKVEIGYIPSRPLKFDVYDLERYMEERKRKNAKKQETPARTGQHSSARQLLARANHHHQRKDPANLSYRVSSDGSITETSSSEDV